MKKNTTSVKNIGIKAVICFWVFGFFLLKLVYAQSGTNIRFKRISLEQGLSQATVFCIIQDRLGFMWFGTQDGLNKYDGYRFTIYRHDPENSTSLSDNYIWSIFEDSRGNLWISTQNGGLNKFDRKTETFTCYQNQSDNPHSLSHNTVKPIFEDSDGNLWIGTYGGGLNKFDRKAETFTRYQHQVDNPKSLSHNSISSIYEDSRGTLWIGTDGGGLNKFDRKAESFTRYQNQDDNPSSLSSNFILMMFEDAGGNLWIGTQGGLNRLDRRAETFIHYRNRADDPKSLSNSQVWSIFEDTGGNLWIGTLVGGLNNFDRKTETFTYYKNQADNPKSLSHNFVTSMYEDTDGNLWIGTRGGLNKFDRKLEKFICYKNQPDNPQSLSNNYIFKIFEDSEGNLWIGTVGGGLDKFDQRTKTFIHYQNQDDNPRSLSNNRVWSICEDAGGTLWIGTDSGLNKFDRKSDSFTRYQNQADNPRSLSNNSVWSIFEDNKGALWIGTHSGLNKFDPEAETFFYYTEKDGLPNEVIYGILEDDNGHLWLSTNKGISKFNPKSRKFINYDKKDGLQSNEFNAGAYYKDRSGRMYFGGVNGFNEFYPEKVQDNTYIPPVVITEFLLFNKPVGVTKNGIKSDKFQLKQHINFTKEIILDYTDYIFTFEFSALNYRQSEKNQFAYKLEGFDREWIETDYLHRRATYTDLSHGKYIFRVKASNDDGYWNEEGTSIKLTILPPPWKTWWAYTFYTLALLGLIFWFIQSQRKKVRQKQKELDHEKEFSTQLEQKVQERTAELKEANLKLEELNLKLEKLAVTDGLTGIANHRRYEEFYNTEWNRSARSGRPISVIMIDIDFFKLYNDTYGHQMGDECLKMVAKVLDESVNRLTDIVARYGGEEFVVVLSETDSSGAEVVAEKLRTGVELLKLIHEESQSAEHVTISLGCATTIPQPGGILETLIHEADRALYQSKQKGRNRVTVANI